MKPPTMDSLREQGYKIKITHYRITQFGMFSSREIDEDNLTLLRREAFHEPNVTPRFTQRHIIQPCGGKVTCGIEGPNGLHSEGVSVVSKKDNFTKNIGTAMAFGRAWKPFSLYGKADLRGYPIGADIIHRKTKQHGGVMGSRIITIRKPPSMYLIQYVIAWNNDPKTILCVDEDEIERVNSGV